eukprot:s1350_g2.t1
MLDICLWLRSGGGVRVRGGYASVDMSDALGRLGTWGVFAVGATVGSVAMSGLLAMAWQRRKFQESAAQRREMPRRRQAAQLRQNQAKTTLDS